MELQGFYNSVTDLFMKIDAEIENFTRQHGSIEKKLKNMATKIKSTTDRFNCRLDTSERRKSNLEDKLIENIQDREFVFLVL